jgi:hypothetical protein
MKNEKAETLVFSSVFIPQYPGSYVRRSAFVFDVEIARF